MNTVIRAASAIVFAALVLAAGTMEAHDPIPSKYTFNEHVSPILNEHCGRCHSDGAAAPMSVTSYATVRPWADAIREQMLQGVMPPWFVDPSGPAIAGPRLLSAHELDTLLTWAAGGAPEGDRANTPPTRPSAPEWSLGQPDATVAMEAPYAMPASKQDETRDFDLPTRFPTTRWISSVDILPGTRSMVRDARITTGDGSVLGVWVAGDHLVRASRGAAFRLSAGATLRLRIHYRKSWEDGQVARSDQSVIGLYFTQPPAAGHDIRSIAAGPVAETVQVLAVRPVIDEPYASVSVAGVAPDGKRTTLLRLRSAQPGWPRRYWLLQPARLQAGSQIVAESSQGDPIEVALDVVDP